MIGQTCRLSLLVSGSLAFSACATERADFREPTLAGLDARVVVAVADGDFRASTYADQTLTPIEASYRDRLMVWRPGIAEPNEIYVSNSVTSPPEVLTVSLDGRFAYVVERLGQRSQGMGKVSELPHGGRLSAVALDGKASQGASAVDLGSTPEAIDLRPDGRMLAAVSNTPQRSLVHLIPVDGGTLTAPTTIDLADLGITGQSDGPRGGVTASAVFWRPDGQALAVTLNTLNRVAFFRVDGPDSAPRLTPWGPPIATGRDPFTGRFTPDGRHFLSLDWGRNFAATSFEERFPTTPSRISVIRLADIEDAARPHRRLGDAPTDLSSEGIAVSPDGTLVAAISMRGTALPRQSERYTPDASVVLLYFDGDSGVLTPVDRAPFLGVLPEGASFDLSGRRLLVTAFERFEEPGGALHVFEITGFGASARLAKRGVVTTPHGIHHVVVR